jgi:gamma-glutamylputrescine oxidase
VSGSFWLAEEAPPLRSGRHAGRVDVAIVGAGITGCAAALRLAEAGLSVRVHEARTVASGASGRSGGFALRGGAARYDLAREAYGREAAREYWRWSERALERMRGLGGDLVRRTGSLRLALDDEERDAVRAEYDALREDGFEAEWRDGAIFHPGDGAFHPARFVRRLAAAAVAAGAELREQDRVADVESLDAEQVLVATDGLGRGLVPELDDAIAPVRNQVLVTEPLGERLFDCPHYARHGFVYWQQLDDGRILLGGMRDLALDAEATDEEATTPLIQEALDDFLRQLVGPGARVSQRWAGVFGSTGDLLPLVGRVRGRERLWVAAGYSGHGNVLGLACGELVADAILDRPRDRLLQGLLDPARPPTSGANSAS